MRYLKFCLLIILMFIMKLNVDATSLGLSVSCPSTAYSGTVNCTINANVQEGSINGINANYSFSNASFQSFTPASGWSAYNNSSNGFAIGNINGISGSKNVGTLTLNVTASPGNNVKVGLTNIGASDTDYNDITVSNTSTTINIIEPATTKAPETTTKITTTRKKLATLNTLSIDGYEITFNKNTFEYVLDVPYDVDKLNINATPSDSNSKITGIGEISINEGENIILIKVTNPNIEGTTYTIKVNRQVKVSNVVSNNIDEITYAFNSNKELIVNLNSETDNLVIPQLVIDTIKNTDRKITYNILTNNEVLYYYEFIGEKITENYSDINLNLEFIDVKKYTKDNKVIAFENTHNGFFPTGTILNIKNTNNISSNQKINLYKLNIENNLELINNNIKEENNYLKLNIEKGSKYIISNKLNQNENSKMNTVLMIIIIILFATSIVLGILVLKKLIDIKKQNN